jgi:antitoxin (DNA-binding transcriptional repressor) of toxin-antitoxin stability system
MSPIEVLEGQTQLAELVALVEKGEEVIIARNGKAVARLTVMSAAKKPSIRYGALKGKVWIADDFDAPLSPEMLTEFEDDPIWPPER